MKAKLIRMEAESVRLSKMSKNLKKMRVTSVQFNSKWLKALDSLLVKMVPYTDFFLYRVKSKIRTI